MNKESLSLMEAARRGDEAASTALLEEHKGLIWTIVRRYMRRPVDVDDLYQLACLGFLKAIRGFEPSYGHQFSTYAVPKIAGEIRRFLRDDGMIKVSRSTKERANFIWQKRDALEKSLGREPSLSELATETGLSIEDIAATDLASAPVSSLHAPMGEEDFSLEQTLSTGSPEETIVEHIDLQIALQKLDKRSGEILYLRYYKGLTQEKIAERLAISQVQVSRLEKKAVLALRKELLPH